MIQNIDQLSNKPFECMLIELDKGTHLCYIFHWEAQRERWCHLDTTFSKHTISLGFVAPPPIVKFVLQQWRGEGRGISYLIFIEKNVVLYINVYVSTSQWKFGGTHTWNNKSIYTHSKLVNNERPFIYIYIYIRVGFIARPSDMGFVLPRTYQICWPSS